MADGIASTFKIAFGWIPTILLITNSKRAKPMPSLGVCEKLNAMSGLPTFIMILHGAFGNAVVDCVVTS